MYHSKDCKDGTKLSLATVDTASVIKKHKTTINSQWVGPATADDYTRTTWSFNTSVNVIASLAILANGLLSLDSTEFTGLVNWGWCELDVLLRGNSNHEGWNVHELLSDGNVSLSDEDTGVMEWFGVVPHSDLCLQSSLHELGEGQTKYVIELSLIFLE